MRWGVGSRRVGKGLFRLESADNGDKGDGEISWTDNGTLGLAGGSWVVMISCFPFGLGWTFWIFLVLGSFDRVAGYILTSLNFKPWTSRIHVLT
jgi:hypothetical protein